MRAIFKFMRFVLRDLTSPIQWLRASSDSHVPLIIYDTLYASFWHEWSVRVNSNLNSSDSWRISHVLSKKITHITFWRAAFFPVNSSTEQHALRPFFSTLWIIKKTPLFTPGRNKRWEFQARLKLTVALLDTNFWFLLTCFEKKFNVGGLRWNKVRKMRLPRQPRFSGA